VRFVRIVVAALTATVLLPASAAATSASVRSSSLPRCTSRQLHLTGGLQGATQSLLGELRLRNRTARSCALPAAPRRVSLVIGTQVLPTLTLRLHGGGVPPLTPTRRLPAHGSRPRRPAFAVDSARLR
jgi:hypothetical protein